MMTTLHGTVERITYQNDENGFTVFRLHPEQGGAVVACVGTTPTVEPGHTVVLNGSYERHARFGSQFVVQSYEIVRPTTREGIIRLLSSGFVANLGKSRAEAIVGRFGEQTLDILDNEPDRLLEVSGIGRKILGRIREAWDAQRHLRALLLFLQGFGVTLSTAYKIYRAYGAEAQARLSANPYALIEDVWGVGFQRADAIAQKLGFTHDSYKRIQAGLTYVLQQAMGEGHCFLPLEELRRRAVEVLTVEEGLVVYSLDHALQARVFEREEQRVYLPLLFRAERAVGEILHERVSRPRAPVDTEAVRRWFAQHASSHGVTLDGKQLEACVGAVEHGLFVLTGGPGTGKTTTLQVLVAYFQSRHARISLAAPTGRAAQRMGSVAGFEAQTIHRLLEFRPQSTGARFGRNADNPLEVDVVVVDEASMIDIALMRSLLEALPPHARLVVVGDGHQLPSIGPGAVLADLIGSGVVAHVELTTVFRQAARSRIVTCAHQIRRGEQCRFDNGREDDCFFMRREDPEQTLAMVVELVCTRLPRRYGFDPRTDIQVLAPMHRGPVGTRAINQVLQRRLSRGGRSLTRGEVTYAIGDRVMQIRNNYDRGVFNGDIGSVVEVTDDDELRVAFAQEPVRYSLRELDELTHAYCISIHKSQGCEFKAVVIPLSTQHYVMLQRNLIYTALTRARQMCVFVGSARAFGMAVRAEGGLRRNTHLSRLISQGGVGP